MPKPTEHESVQARILKYADEIGWTTVPRSEAEKQRVPELEFEGIIKGMRKDQYLTIANKNISQRNQTITECNEP